jgi:uncharacterized membrane protein YidH (DUF202 family)
MKGEKNALAEERTIMAEERTIFAKIRTILAIVGVILIVAKMYFEVPFWVLALILTIICLVILYSDTIHLYKLKKKEKGLEEKTGI